MRTLRFALAVVLVLCVEIDAVRVDHLYPRALLTPFTDDVEDRVADRHADARLVLVVAQVEDADREVLNGKLGVPVGRLDPGASPGGVASVHARGGHRRRSDARSPTGSSKEQEPNDPSPVRRASASAAVSRR